RARCSAESARATRPASPQPSERRGHVAVGVARARGLARLHAVLVIVISLMLAAGTPDTFGISPSPALGFARPRFLFPTVRMGCDVWIPHRPSQLVRAFPMPRKARSHGKRSRRCEAMPSSSMQACLHG